MMKFRLQNEKVLFVIKSARKNLDCVITITTLISRQELLNSSKQLKNLDPNMSQTKLIFFVGGSGSIIVPFFISNVFYC